MAKRGGRRAGTPGKAYSNRTDMNAVRTLPAMAPTGLPYGEHKQLVDMQQTVALPAAAGPPAAPSAADAAPSPPLPAPGGLGAFDRPSERPTEPVTAGSAHGPGPGLEALNLGGPALGGQTMAALLEQVAAASGSTDLAQLAQKARSLGQ